MRFEDFWYVVAASDALGPAPLARQVLGEWLVVFRGPDGRPAVLQDRCMHRAGRLSDGRVVDGCVQCPYHGWTYSPDGEVMAVPAEGDDSPRRVGRRTVAYPVVEADGYVYTCLSDTPATDAPFAMPCHGRPGYATVRLRNRFHGSVTDCVENFIDVPHTVSVHPGIFRESRRQEVTATITRRDGRVEVVYEGETDNLGWFRRFLNPDGHPIAHVDRFVMPNVTSVEYRFGPRRHLFITSQSVPVGPTETLVYTDLTFDYGRLTPLARPLIRWQGQKVIDQDVAILGRQREVLDRYGRAFHNTPADAVHVMVESIRGAIAKGRDPRELPPRTRTVRMWV